MGDDVSNTRAIALTELIMGWVVKETDMMRCFEEATEGMGDEARGILFHASFAGMAIGIYGTVVQALAAAYQTTPKGGD